jgi:hypothetical protein
MRCCRIRASFERITKPVEVFGLERVHEPHIRHIAGRMWKMRLGAGTGSRGLAT